MAASITICGQKMYKGFAIATVLIALVVGLFAGNLPGSGADNATNAAEETASNAAEPAPAVAAVKAAPPPPAGTVDAAAPLAAASAPTLVLDEYSQPAAQKTASAPAPATTPAQAPVHEVNPIPTGDKFPPGKILTSTFQADGP